MDKSASPAKRSSADIFLLTKPPSSERAKLCMLLIMRSDDAILYLAGDGVYNLLGDSLAALPKERILACREDVEARGIQAGDRAMIVDDFYERLVNNIMHSEKLYTL